jgi:SAM-dependent methyltransferase
VRDEGTSLYGLNYFNEHARGMGHPSLEERARNDLSERCVFWLRTLLGFRLPPARTLELGCANGAFVALLAEAGYRSTGLDLSPAVTQQARDAFQIPVLTGLIEDQGIPPSSFDVIVMMDVVEHLLDPVGTLRHVGRALTDDGLLLLQTPHYDPSLSFEQMRAASHPFLAQLRPNEHVFLLSQPSITALLAQAGFPFLRFVPAIFSFYDMSLVASRAPLHEVPEVTWREALRRTRSGRLVESLMDSGIRNLVEIPALRGQVAEVEGARGRLQAQAGKLAAEVERLRSVEADVRELHRLRADDQSRLQANADRIADLEAQLAETLGKVRAQAELIGSLEEEARKLGREVEKLSAERARLERVEAAYLEVLRRMGPLARIFGAKRPGQ